MPAKQLETINAKLDRVKDRHIRREETTSIVLCRSRDDGRFAIPVDKVERLTDISSRTVRKSGLESPPELEIESGLSIPLIQVEDTLPERRCKPRNPGLYHRSLNQDRFPVAICFDEATDRRIGLVLTEVLGVVQLDEISGRRASRPGIESCVIVRNHVAEILDVDAIAAWGLAMY